MGEPSSAAAGSFTISCTACRSPASCPAALPPATMAICCWKASRTLPNTFSTTPARCVANGGTCKEVGVTRLVVTSAGAEQHTEHVPDP